jgi:hypothetical protein
LSCLNHSVYRMSYTIYSFIISAFCPHELRSWVLGTGVETIMGRSVRKTVEPSPRKGI